MPLITRLEKQRQENWEFKAILSCTMSLRQPGLPEILHPNRQSQCHKHEIETITSLKICFVEIFTRISCHIFGFMGLIRMPAFYFLGMWIIEYEDEADWKETNWSICQRGCNVVLNMGITRAPHSTQPENHHQNLQRKHTTQLANPPTNRQNVQGNITYQ